MTGTSPSSTVPHGAAERDRAPGTTREVVVGFDGSLASQRALARAAEEAVARGIPLTVLTLTGEAPAAEAEVPAGTETAVQTVVETHPRLDVHVTSLPATATDEVQALLDRCELLVVGDRNRAERRAFLLGSPSRELFRGAHRPVLVIPETELPHEIAPGPVVVGVAATAGDLPVLRAAAEHARRARSSLVVVHATSGQRVPLAEQRVSRVLAEAGLDPALPVSVELTVASAATALTSVPGASLVVVGTRGPLALARLALGSVSREVLDAARTPVLVVPGSPG